MKKTLITFSLFCAAVAAPFLVSGCATPEPYKQADATRREAQKLRDKLGELSAQINATDIALQAVVDAPDTDPSARYKVFTDAADKVVAMDKETRALAAAVQSKAKVVTDNWDANLANIPDAAIRKNSYAQKEEYRQQFQSVREATDNVGKSIDTYTSKLDSVRVYLNNNLSPAGIRGASNYSKEISRLGNDAMVEIRKVVGVVTKVADATAPSAIPVPAE